ncbi:BON domain-containing protein [Luteimonas sp. R10]|uniref:BON domain-containing protein n=1 Tax=Luteimonas sp. R10 TaxID=3108176 RepID=UPI003089741F|nr:BON domain-containing protein [Luteimonas sp. R10]
MTTRHHQCTALAAALSTALLFVAGGALAQDAGMEPEEQADTQMDSDQPVDDTWITTKVKSSLLADTDVAGLDIDVETVNGVVTLSGDVDDRAQIEQARQIAADIDGVVEVDTSGLTTASGTSDY